MKGTHDGSQSVDLRDSSIGTPAVQSVPLVGLTVLLAAILGLNLRLAGVSMMDWAPVVAVTDESTTTPITLILRCKPRPWRASQEVTCLAGALF